MPEACAIVVKELEGNLDRDATAVTGERVGIDRAAVREIAHALHRQLHDAMRAAAVNVRDEARAAGVSAVLGPIEQPVTLVGER
jgi:hypothetical protein